MLGLFRGELQQRPDPCIIGVGQARPHMVHQEWQDEFLDQPEGAQIVVRPDVIEGQLFRFRQHVEFGRSCEILRHEGAAEVEFRAGADHIVDLGPGAGRDGGRVVVAGDIEEIQKQPGSLTGRYLSGEMRIECPPSRRQSNGKCLVVKGARHNNLKDLTVNFPLGLFIGVTGVSGSGKSSLVDDILYKALSRKLHRALTDPGGHDAIQGIELLDKVIEIDQSPIGRTPRSNPATYTGLFSHIRDLFSMLPESRIRGYKPGRFSFNVKGGRCETCQGDGLRRIEMNFLPDVHVLCEACQGKRYNGETLAVKYKGYSIADLLDMNISDAYPLLENIPPIAEKLRTLNDVGLGYVQLGQPATTLSGGEAQRVKLARELSRRATGRTLYILDEPTTGLSLGAVRKLLEVTRRLTNAGHTALVIEQVTERGASVAVWSPDMRHAFVSATSPTRDNLPVLRFIAFSLRAVVP